MKSGIVALAGRPNVGKSSLVNRLVGVHLAAVSARPQTTWTALRGVLSCDAGQVVFIDTPGLHAARDLMNQAMLTDAAEAIADADAVLFVLEATGPSRRDRQLLAAMQSIVGERPLIVAVNKVDTVTRDAVLPVIQGLLQSGCKHVVPVSALDGANLPVLRDLLLASLPEGPPLFPDEELSDQPLRYFAAEYVRQAAFETLREELPYSIFVEVDDFFEDRDPVVVRATMHVERESQKRIVVGEGGQQIREIGRRARIALEALIERRVFLELWVKVLPRWTKRDAHLKRAGLAVEPKRRKRVQELVRKLAGDEAGDALPTDSVAEGGAHD